MGEGGPWVSGSLIVPFRLREIDLRNEVRDFGEKGDLENFARVVFLFFLLSNAMIDYCSDGCHFNVRGKYGL